MRSNEIAILDALNNLEQVEDIGVLATSTQHPKSAAERLVASGYITRVTGYKLTARGRQWLVTQGTSGAPRDYDENGEAIW